MISPTQLAEWIGGRWQNCVPTAIEGFSIDSRTLRAGQCFVALRTRNRDGHDFVASAADSGASCALVSSAGLPRNLPVLLVDDTLIALQSAGAAHRKSFKGPVVGITGTVGKTSTKDLLAILLGGGEDIHRTAGNFNNHLGVPLTLLDLDPAKHKVAVIEAGTNSEGEIPELARWIQPTASIITAVTPVHMEGFSSLEHLADEKAALGYATAGDGFVVFPEDCLQFGVFRSLAEERPEAGKIQVLCSADSSAALPFEIDLPPDCIALWTKPKENPPVGGCRIELRQPSSNPVSFQLPTASPGMARNALLAILAARRLGVSDEAISERLLRWQPAKLRGQVLHADGKLFYADCYNASPASMLDAFAAFASTAPEAMPRFYVLGSMAELGHDSPELHEQVGRSLKLRPHDQALLFGDDAGSYADGLEEAGNSRDQFSVIDDIECARRQISRFHGAVLLKGSRVHRLEGLLPSSEEGGAKRSAESPSSSPDLSTIQQTYPREPARC